MLQDNLHYLIHKQFVNRIEELRIESNLSKSISFTDKDHKKKKKK